MKIDDSKVLLSGANGGTGRAFVQALLTHGPARIYLSVRNTVAVQLLLAMSNHLAPTEARPEEASLGRVAGAG